MPALPPHVTQRIDALLADRTQKIKSGAIPLKFIGKPPNASWRADAGRTFDAAVRLFLPMLEFEPGLDRDMVQQLLGSMHLKGLKLPPNLPLNAFLDEFDPTRQQAAPSKPSRPELTRRHSTGSLPAKPQQPAPAKGATSLRPMLSLMKHGIIERHPALLEFLHAAVEAVEALDSATRTAFKNHVRASDGMMRLIHTTYIMDLLTASMNNSKEFAFELQTHLYNELLAKRINPFSTVDTFKGILDLPGATLFQGVKTISVFPAMTLLLARRFNNGLAPNDQQIQAIAASLTWSDQKALKLSQETNASEDTGLLINVNEAIISDWTADRRDNAAVGAMYCSRLYNGKVGAPNQYPAGWVLPVGLQGTTGDVQHPFYDALLEDIRKMETFKVKRSKDGPNGTKITFEETMIKNYHSTSYDDDWSSLYHTWNLAFILAEIPDLALIAPKLLAPAVLCAKGEQYLFSRVHALWAAICFMILKAADGNQVLDHLPSHTAWAKLYGAINVEQGWQYMKNRPENRYKNKAEFMAYWQDNAPGLVGGAAGYLRLAAHAFFGWTSRLA